MKMVITLILSAYGLMGCATFFKQENEFVIVSACQPDHILNGKMLLKCKKE